MTSRYLFEREHDSRSLDLTQEEFEGFCAALLATNMLKWHYPQVTVWKISKHGSQRIHPTSTEVDSSSKITQEQNQKFMNDIFSSGSYVTMTDHYLEKEEMQELLGTEQLSDEDLKEVLTPEKILAEGKSIRPLRRYVYHVQGIGGQDIIYDSETVDFLEGLIMALKWYNLYRPGFIIKYIWYDEELTSVATDQELTLRA